MTSPSWRIAWRGVCVMGACFLASVAARADETGEQLLTNAASHVGDRDILTGEFRYTLLVTERPPDQAMIERRTEEIRELLREDLKQAGDNEDLRRRYQKAIDTAHEYVPPQLIRNASKTMNYYFVVGGPQLGSDRYVEFSLLNLETETFGPATTLLQRHLGVGRQLNLYLDGGNGTAVASENAVSGGSQEPQRLGRLNGLLADLALDPTYAQGLPFGNLIKDVELATVDAAQSADLREIRCRISPPNSSAVIVKCQIDPSRGYIAPSVQELDEAGKLLREWECKDYFRDTDTGLWFAKLCVYRERSKDPKEDMPRSERYEFTPEGVRLNVQLPEERFAVALNRGNTLIDGRHKENKSYKAGKEVKVSLEALAEIRGIDGLSLVGAKSISSPGVPGTLESSPRIWLMLANVLVLLVLAGWLMKRRMARGNAAAQ